MAGLSLEVGAGPAKAPIATAHSGETGKHTIGLSTCIVVSKTSLYPLSRFAVWCHLCMLSVVSGPLLSLSLVVLCCPLLS